MFFLGTPPAPAPDAAVPADTGPQPLQPDPHHAPGADAPMPDDDTGRQQQAAAVAAIEFVLLSEDSANADGLRASAAASASRLKDSRLAGTAVENCSATASEAPATLPGVAPVASFSAVLRGASGAVPWVSSSATSYQSGYSGATLGHSNAAAAAASGQLAAESRTPVAVPPLPAVMSVEQSGLDESQMTDSHRASTTTAGLRSHRDGPHAQTPTVTVGAAATPALAAANGLLPGSAFTGLLSAGLMAAHGTAATPADDQVGAMGGLVGLGAAVIGSSSGTPPAPASMRLEASYPGGPGGPGGSLPPSLASTDPAALAAILALRAAEVAPLDGDSPLVAASRNAGISTTEGRLPTATGPHVDSPSEFTGTAAVRERRTRGGRKVPPPLPAGTTELIINYLPESVGDAELRELFERHGEVVAAAVARHRDTGLGRCFGFVRMADAESASRAASAIGGSVMRQKRLKVSAALSGAASAHAWTNARADAAKLSLSGPGGQRVSGGFGVPPILTPGSSAHPTPLSSTTETPGSLFPTPATVPNVPVGLHISPSQLPATAPQHSSLSMSGPARGCGGGATPPFTINAVSAPSAHPGATGVHSAPAQSISPAALLAACQVQLFSQQQQHDAQQHLQAQARAEVQALALAQAQAQAQTQAQAQARAQAAAAAAGVAPPPPPDAGLPALTLQFALAAQQIHRQQQQQSAVSSVMGPSGATGQRVDSGYVDPTAGQVVPQLSDEHARRLLEQLGIHGAAN